MGGTDKAGGFWVGTVVFLIMGVIANAALKFNGQKNDPANNLLKHTLTITAFICCWMMWGIIYLAQMNPLVMPILGE